MSNMSYCRFSNTIDDLEDCQEFMEDPCSPAEHKARAALIRLCEQIAANKYDTDELEVSDE